MKYSHMKDEDLIKNIQVNQNTDKSLETLIERNSGICVEMINSYI